MTFPKWRNSIRTVPRPKEIQGLRAGSSDRVVLKIYARASYICQWNESKTLFSNKDWDLVDILHSRPGQGPLVERWLLLLCYPDFFIAVQIIANVYCWKMPILDICWLELTNDLISFLHSFQTVKSFWGFAIIFLQLLIACLILVCIWPLSRFVELGLALDIYFSMSWEILIEYLRMVLQFFLLPIGAFFYSLMSSGPTVHS